MKRELLTSANMQRIEGLALALAYKRLEVIKNLENEIYEELDKITDNRFHKQYLKDRVSFALSEISKYHAIGSLVESYNPAKHIKHILKDL